MKALKRVGCDAYYRSRIEPVNPEDGFPSGEGYLHPVKGHPVPWMCYCVYRYDWLIRSMIKRGISMEYFMPGSKEVPKEKCQEIARELRKMLSEEDYEDDLSEELLKIDIKFYAHCGGLRLHEWEGIY